VKEFCSCNAAIHTLSKRQVKLWRTNHRHDAQSDPEPDKQGSQAHVERAAQYDYDQSSYTARIGFQAND
jgi:hypothetical protein